MISRGDGRHERVYRALLRLYPNAFRSRHGDDMVQLFGDQLRDARSGSAGPRVAGTWLRTIGDVIVTAASEHARRDRTVGHSLAVAPSGVTRALGFLGILGGAVLLVAFLPSLDLGGGANTVRLVIFNLGAIAIAVAVHRRQAVAAPRWTTAVVAALVVANAWYIAMTMLAIGRPVYPDPDPTFRPIVNAAANALWLTSAAFGLLAWRIGRVHRGAAAALAVGAALAAAPPLSAVVGADIRGSLIESAALLGVALVGLGWIGLGIDITTRKTEPEPRSEPVSRS